jgi:hypothetical protein
MNNMNIHMNMNMFLIILIIFILCYTNLERFFIETATYLGKVIIREDVKCEKDVDVKGVVNANQLCIDDTCINKSKLQFIKQLPLKLKTAVCIGNTCVDENSFKVIKKLTEIKNESVVNFKVVSSGMVLGQYAGVAEFYVNGTPMTGIRIGRGFNIMVLNENGSFNDFRVFDTGGDIKSNGDVDNVDEIDARKDMIDYIKNIDWGLFVMVAIYEEATVYDSPMVKLYDNEDGWIHPAGIKAWGGWFNILKINPDGTELYIKHGTDKFRDDSLSRIKVGKDIQVTLYVDNKNRGESNTYKSGHDNTLKKNNETTHISVRKNYTNDIVTVYEALKLVGSRGKIAPNYRGSYALIGRRGMNPGEAKEEVKNSSADYRTHHQVTIEKTIKSGDLYVKLTE